MKKLLSLVLVLTLTCGLCIPLFASAEAEPTTLTMFVDETWWRCKDWDSTMAKWFTEQTGIAFDVTVCADKTELDMMVASGSLPDVIVAGDFNLLSNEYVSYDYDYLMDTYNIEGDIHPAYKFVNQATDGKYYAVMVGFSADYEYAQYPTVNPEGVCATARMDILTGALEKQGIDKITTVDELEGAFEYCKEQYPDVIPFVFNPIQSSWMYALYGGADGGFVDNDGKAQLWINSPKLKNAMMKLNEWHRKGYMTSENYALTDSTTPVDMAVSGKVFVYGTLTNGSMNIDDNCKKANVDYEWTPLSSIYTEDSVSWETATGWRGFFITKDCKDPEAAMKALMFFLDKDTGYQMLWGIEGKDWEWNADQTEAIYHYDTSSADFKIVNGLDWGYLGHDGISNNMAYGSNPKTRESLAWKGSITVRNPVLGMVKNRMDVESQEYIIYEQLVELEENYAAKIGMAATAEDAEALYNEMITIAEKLGTQKVEDWANEMYPGLYAEYEAVRGIGAEGWE